MDVCDACVDELCEKCLDKIAVKRAEKLADQLGMIAFKYRGTRNVDERREFAKQYAEHVEILVKTGKWHEVLAPEDQLPDCDMPEAYFKHWGLRWPRS